MLTFIKEILTSWNRQTVGTRLQTIFSGKIVGQDEFVNKSYVNKKKKKRWVIYSGEIEATKIPIPTIQIIEKEISDVENKTTKTIIATVNIDSIVETVIAKLPTPQKVEIISPLKTPNIKENTKTTFRIFRK